MQAQAITYVTELEGQEAEQLLDKIQFEFILPQQEPEQDKKVEEEKKDESATEPKEIKINTEETKSSVENKEEEKINTESSK